MFTVRASGGLSFVGSVFRYDDTDESQWNPDFSNIQGKRKLVREFEGGIELRSIGQVLFDYNTKRAYSPHSI